MTRKLLLIGATGATGRQLLAQALEQGHEVTALVRDPGKLTVDDAHLRLLTGDATDPTVVDEATDGQDAVLCALGTRSPASLLTCDLMHASMRALVPAMEGRGVRRLILLSALGVGESARHAPRALRLAFRTLFREVGRDKAAAEEHVRASGLEWTVVYPPSLTNGPRTGDYRSGPALELKGMPKISRADVAEFMLAQVGDGAYSRRIAIVG
jgi:putative NADH-flavin reductase